jgi:hypothetical protein
MNLTLSEDTFDNGKPQKNHLLWTSIAVFQVFLIAELSQNVATVPIVAEKVLVVVRSDGKGGQATQLTETRREIVQHRLGRQTMTIDVVVELVLKIPLRSLALLYLSVRVVVIDSRSLQKLDELL